MLEKPDLPDERIVASLRDAYGLRVAQLDFLPLGVDVNAAVYRAVADDGAPYFVKLRSGAFDEITVALPRFLNDQGIAHIIAPLPTRTGHLWATLDAFALMVYPFIHGRDGYEVALSEQQWREFGATMRRVHTVSLPAALADRIPQETFSPPWPETVRAFLHRAEHETFDDPTAAKLATFLASKHGVILDLAARTDRLAASLRARSLDFVLCHSDIHPGNLLIEPSGAFYIVDWDNPILAPKERDLMFIGGGWGFVGHTAQEEETLFYQGYGETEVDPAALAYYRYERTVEDIGLFCEQLLSTNEGGEDREQALRYLMSSFLPHGIIEIAYESDRTLKGGVTWQRKSW